MKSQEPEVLTAAGSSGRVSTEDGERFFCHLCLLADLLGMPDSGRKNQEIKDTFTFSFKKYYSCIIFSVKISMSLKDYPTRTSSRFMG